MSEVVFIPLFLIGFIIIVLLIYNNNVVVKKYKLKSDKIKSPLKIVLLSDFHNKRGAKYMQKIIDKTRAQNPDIIVIDGDTVDRRKPDFDRGRAFVSEISKIAKTYFITGNHERILGKAECVTKLECNDILFDECYEIYEDYSVLGLCDASTNSDILSLFSRLENYKIVFVHKPIEFYKNLTISDYDIDLVLSGHTHGGLVRIPFFGAVVSPDEGFFPQYSKGLYHKNGTTLVVSGGLGNTYLPLRINNFPQIVSIEINL